MIPSSSVTTGTGTQGTYCSFLPSGLYRTVHFYRKFNLGLQPSTAPPTVRSVEGIQIPLIQYLMDPFVMSMTLPFDDLFELEPAYPKKRESIGA
jgi:hypothetical protein